MHGSQFSWTSPRRTASAAFVRDTLKLRAATASTRLEEHVLVTALSVTSPSPATAWTSDSGTLEQRTDTLPILVSWDSR